MKTLKTKWVCALAALVAACGGGGERASEVKHAPTTVVDIDEPAARPPPSPPASSSRTVELRLLGAHGPEGGTLLMGVRALRVTAGGQELAVDVTRTPVDLANGTHAWLVGTFQVPEGVEAVQVALHLDDYGGFVDAHGSGEVDARGLPIRFEAPVKLLSTRGRAVVHLDLARSLVDAGEERKVLLPQYGVYY